MPPDTIYVGRPTRWGNAWKIGDNLHDESAPGGWRVCETLADCVQGFRQSVDWDPSKPSYLPTFDEDGNRAGGLEIWGGYDDNIHVNRRSIRRFLKGKNLACWCPLDQPCHADILLEFANPPICEAVA